VFGFEPNGFVTGGGVCGKQKDKRKSQNVPTIEGVVHEQLSARTSFPGSRHPARVTQAAQRKGVRVAAPAFDCRVSQAWQKVAVWFAAG
jgi:hypothetical protein